MSQYFRIQEVASLHNVSKKTLLYYDQIGLFKPDHLDAETGYRFYVKEQFPYLKQIIYLKDLNFSLKEIQDLLEDRRIEPLLVKIDEKLAGLEGELERLVQKKNDLTYLKNFYEQAQYIDERDLYKPGIMFFDDRIMAYEPCVGDETPMSSKHVMLAYRKLLRKMINLSKISQMPYGTIVLNPDDHPSEMYHSIGSFVMLPESLGLKNEVVAKGGKYAYMYKKGGYYDPKSAQILYDWCLENGYKPVGNMYDFCIIDFTFSKSEASMILQIQVRIE